MKTNNKCMQCGHEMKETTENHVYDEGGANVLLEGVPVLTCPSCGEKEIGIPRMEELHRTIAKDLAEREERLAPNEIRFLRKHLGLSTEDFAKVMGVDPGTVKHWEGKTSPRTMSRAAERLLRFMALNDKPIENYPLAEMASKDTKPPRRKFRMSKGGWRIEAR